MEILSSVTNQLKGIHPLVYASATGVIFAFWGRIKGLILRADKFIFRTISFSSYRGNSGFIHFIINRYNLKRSVFSDDSYNLSRVYYKPHNNMSDIVFQDQIPSAIEGKVVVFFWKRFIPIFIYTESSKSGNRDASAPLYLSIKTLFIAPLVKWLEEYQAHILNIENRSFFIEDVVGDRTNYTSPKEVPQYRNKSLESSDDPIYVIDKKSGEITFNVKPAFINKEDLIRPDDRAKKNYYIPESLKPFMEDFKFFLDSEKWYSDRNLTYKRGYLLYGPAGTGKTYVVRYLAEENKIPIFRFDLGTMSNGDFKNAWNRHSSGKGVKIVLIEDFSSIFNCRDNITNIDGTTPGVSFDCFLNTVDGVQKESGVILIITTNHPELLDEALYKVSDGNLPSRPGRIDMAIGFSHLDTEGKYFIGNIILKGYGSRLDKLIKTSGSCTPAQFEELCKQEAKAIYLEETRSRIFTNE